MIGDEFSGYLYAGNVVLICFRMCYRLDLLKMGSDSLPFYFTVSLNSLFGCDILVFNVRLYLQDRFYTYIHTYIYNIIIVL